MLRLFSIEVLQDLIWAPSTSPVRRQSIRLFLDEQPTVAQLFNRAAGHPLLGLTHGFSVSPQLSLESGVFGRSPRNEIVLSNRSSAVLEHLAHRASNHQGTGHNSRSSQPKDHSCGNSDGAAGFSLLSSRRKSSELL